MEAEMSYLLEEKTRKLENAELLIERLKREVKELDFSVAMHDRAAKKARAIWEEAHPDAEFMPGRTELMVWLIERVEKAEAVKESLTSALGDIKKNVDDWNLQDCATIRRLVNAALRTTEETNNDTHDRPVEMLLLIKELGRMSKKLDALKGSLRNIADNAAHWDTGCGPDASAFGWIHDIAEATLRTAEESSVVDRTPAKQPEGTTKLDKALQNTTVVKRVLVENSCPSEFGLEDCEFNPESGCTLCCEDCWNKEVES